MIPSLAMLIQSKWLDDGLILFNKLIDLSIGSVYKQVNNSKPYYLLSLDPTVDQRSLPLGYAWTGQEPDPLLARDREHCTAEENVPV